MKPIMISDLQDSWLVKKDTEEYEWDSPATFKNCELDVDKISQIICDIDNAALKSPFHRSGSELEVSPMTYAKAISESLDDLIILKEK